MIPRRVNIAPDSPLAAIRPEHAWGALLLAHVHRLDNEEECQCRCCRWVRENDPK